jgi:predicted ATPase/DNA-binding CsgD family transcriptional regulator
MNARHGVPARLSSFVGRKQEMGELQRLFPHTRVLTLLGPGGCGKTRLAIEFARQHESRFADGSIVVELAAVRDPALVGNAIAAAAGLTLRAEDTSAELSRRLRDKHLLAVVDNCEHVIDAVATSLARLLGDCPRISVLATSRERINIDGETAWRVPSLGLPREGDDAESTAAADAVRLFVERARSLRPGFEVDAANVSAIAAICRRLDGVPLAIELAASRVTTLSPAEILPRLEDRFRLLTGGSRNAVERHQTLRAAIDWSYDMLDPSERTLLQRLSVFVGPFSADAAEEICAWAPLDGIGVLDGLQRLVDKSMVQADADSSGELRFRLLETFRDYASKLGDGDAATELRDRHLAFYLRLAEQGFEQFKYGGAMEEHARLWRDIADVRAALEWSRRDPELEVALAACLFFLWVVYAPAERLRRLIDAMGRAPYQVSVVYGRGAWALGALAGRASRPELMVLSLAEFVELADQLDDDFVKAQKFLVRAFTAERRDRDLETAREALSAAVPVMEEYGFLPTLALTLSQLGSVEMQLGNLDKARTPMLRALDVARECGDGYNLLGAYYQLGWLDLECGAIKDARANFMAALELTPAADLLSTAFHVEGLACAEVGVDDRRALALFGGAERMRTEIDTVLGVPWSLRVKPDMARARAALPEADAEAAWRTGLAMAPAEVVASLRRKTSPRSTRRHALAGGLSRRELEVAGLVAAGMTSKSIADRLFLSERTVESHIEHILTKLDFNTRAQVATWVTEQKIGE